MLDTGPGKCGGTLCDITKFKKRNAVGNKDGGVYAAKKFIQQRNVALYDCPQDCQMQTQKTAALTTSLSKTSRGTCITWLDGASGCVEMTTQNAQNAGATDCRPCAAIFNNIAPKTNQQIFGIGISNPQKEPDLNKFVDRVRTSAGNQEPLGNFLRTPGNELLADNTAKCHTDSTFTCPGNPLDWEKDADKGQCTEVLSVKIDKMCDDGPCDSDDNSKQCLDAKAAGLVDQESGMLCMPNTENDPCKIEDGGTIAAVAFTALLALASVL